MGVLSPPLPATQIYIHTPKHIYIYFDKCSVHREVTSGRRHGRGAPVQKGGTPPL